MEQQTIQFAQAWHDILPPLAPAPVSLWLLLGSGVLLLLVVMVVAILWQQQPRQQALRLLRHCRRELHRLHADTHVIALALQRALFHGLGLNPATITGDTQNTQQGWWDYYRHLQRCVFQAQPPTAAELQTLLEQTAYWLKHYPR